MSSHAAAPSAAARATACTSPLPARQVPCTCTPTRCEPDPCASSQPPRAPASRRVPVPLPPPPGQPCPVRSDPAAEGACLQPGRVELEAAVVDVLLGLQGVEQPVPEHPELEAVEEGVDLLPVPGPGDQVRRRGGEVEVADEGVEPAVADDVAQVLPERLPGLALDDVGVGDDVVEPVVLADPLGGRS